MAAPTSGGRKAFDRLGSVVQDGTTVRSYYPYGEDRSNSTEYATYPKDTESGLKYADQRYYNSSLGRFLTPDPYKASAGLRDPGSWNRYSYVGGDPISLLDPNGLLGVFPPTGVWDPVDLAGTTVVAGGMEYYFGFVTIYDSELTPIGVEVIPIALRPVLSPVDTSGVDTFRRAELSGLKRVIGNAVAKASDRIANPDCAGLFFTKEDNTPDNRALLAGKLSDSWDRGEFQLLEAQYAGKIAPSVAGFVNDDNNVIFIEGRTFFTGLGPDGKKLGGGPFEGLGLSELRQLMVIHDYLHKTGLIGSDDAGQVYTLANGMRVTGSAGISQAIRDNCFK